MNVDVIIALLTYLNIIHEFKINLINMRFSLNNPTHIPAKQMYIFENSWQLQVEDGKLAGPPEEHLKHLKPTVRI